MLKHVSDLSRWRQLRAFLRSFDNSTLRTLTRTISVPANSTNIITPTLPLTCATLLSVGIDSRERNPNILIAYYNYNYNNSVDVAVTNMGDTEVTVSLVIRYRPFLGGV